MVKFFKNLGSKIAHAFSGLGRKITDGGKLSEKFLEPGLRAVGGAFRLAQDLGVPVPFLGAVGSGLQAGAEGLKKGRGVIEKGRRLDKAVRDKDIIGGIKAARELQQTFR